MKHPLQSMTDKKREFETACAAAGNDLFYVCSLIEFVGRVTKNRRGDVVKAMSPECLAHQVCFHTSASPACLKFLKRETLAR